MLCFPRLSKCGEAQRLLWDVIEIGCSIPSLRRAPGARGLAKEGKVSASKSPDDTHKPGLFVPPVAGGYYGGDRGRGTDKWGRVEPWTQRFSRRPWPGAARVERPGYDAPTTEAPRARRFPSHGRAWVGFQGLLAVSARVFCERRVRCGGWDGLPPMDVRTAIARVGCYSAFRSGRVRS